MQIVLATHNRGKMEEMAAILGHLPVELLTLDAFPEIGDIPETGNTLKENAFIKAETVHRLTGLPALADDTGLEVDALNGAPGVYSARYAADITEGEVSDEDNTNKLLAALSQVPEEKRSARFHCVLVYMKHENDPTPIICHGVWQGSISREKQGEQGFGYDPVFWQHDLQMSSAQLPRDIKNKLSHRGQALEKLVAKLSLAEK